MTQHTVSSCFEDERYDEQEYIDEVVHQTDVVAHKVFPKETELFEELDNIIWHTDEPFASTSIYAQWDAFKTAKENNLKVMLDGQGVDEQLAGYTAFYTVMFADLLAKGQISKFRKEWRSYSENRAVTEKHISKKTILQSTMGTLLFPDQYRNFIKKFGFTCCKIDSTFQADSQDKF